MPVAPGCSLREPARKKMYDEITGADRSTCTRSSKPVVERELLDGDADSRDGCATRQQNRDGEDEASQHRAGLTR